MKLQSSESKGRGIALCNATKVFAEKHILSNINFEFAEGCNYFIKGESGAGKTTLLNILSHLEPLNSGTVVSQQNITIEYLFQDILLLSDLTVAENLFIKWNSKENGNMQEIKPLMHDVLKKVGISSQAIGQKVNLLSGGERKRVQLAQILLSAPDVVLLDEPTANLDNDNKLEIMRVINTIFEHSIKIIASHDLENISSEYTVLKLEKGELHYEE